MSKIGTSSIYATSLQPAYLAIGYTLALGILLWGLHAALLQVTDLHLGLTIVGFAITAVTFTVKILSWTLIPFIPLTALVARKTFHRVTRGPLTETEKDNHITLIEISLFVGIFGTALGFLMMGLDHTEATQSAIGPSNLSIQAYFMGVGTTVAGFGIALLGLPALFGTHDDEASDRILSNNTEQPDNHGKEN